MNQGVLTTGPKYGACSQNRAREVENCKQLNVILENKWMRSPNCLMRTSTTLLNTPGEIGHPCLVLGLRRKVLKLLQLRVTLTLRFSLVAFIRLKKFPSIPNLGRILKFIYSWIWNGFPLPPHTMTRGKRTANSRVGLFTQWWRNSQVSLPITTEDASISELNTITFKKLIKIASFLWKRIWSTTSDKNNSTVLSYNVYFTALCLHRGAS